MKTDEKKTVSLAETKSTFEMPVIEVITFENEDILATSGIFEGFDDPSDE